jgi:hypothetical protein
MTNRTIHMSGWGSGTAEITAVLDGTTVFDGEVTLEEKTDDNESEQTSPTVFTFELPMDFLGTKHMIISVKGNPVEFGQIVANYTEVDIGSVITYSTGPDEYTDVAVDDEHGVRDPRTNVIIDGVKQEPNRLLGKGTWHYIVNPGSTLEHDLTISVPGLYED